MANNPVPVRASTQKALPIEDVREGIIILKNGNAALILRVSAINFDLLSEKEQEAIIFAYGGLLNSLSFPIQIFIRSQKKDITSYNKLLEKVKSEQKNELLKKLIAHYQKFIKEVVVKTEILDKKFYVVIPFSSLEMGAGHALKKATNNFFASLVKKEPTEEKLDIEAILTKAKNSLYPKRDHLIRLFSRIGLEARTLNNQEVIRLLFKIYNPNSQGIENVLNETYYQAPIVTTTPQLKESASKENQTDYAQSKQNQPPLK